MRCIESRINGWSCFFIFLLVLTFPISYSNISLAETGSQRVGDSQPLLNKDKSNSICKEFSSPFNDSYRKSLEPLEQRLIGAYGEYRKSYKPGHLHAGIDLKGAFNETVYAIGCGQGKGQLLQHGYGRAQHILQGPTQIF
ncbi:MAG: hypothetical protein OEY18_09630 [Candidatus Aminicenantes bacterium]|nr:hypothetical protein [Candidatus Aminicenantes bacterium]MDH5384956.1 hypothetical protein [Candidatus Aminicenantes bacterium]